MKSDHKWIVMNKQGRNGRLKMAILGTSLVVQWLRFHAPNTGGRGSIPGQGTRIPHAIAKKKKKANLQIAMCIYPPHKKIKFKGIYERI